MILYIAEKPSLATAIAHGLGKGQKKDGCFVMNGGQQIVTWCFGHILEQLKPDEYDEKYKRWTLEDLPIVPNPWMLKVSDSCKKQFKIIKDLVAQADQIVNAGDPDREGQLLIDEVLDFLYNKKPVKRILLNALDDMSVQQALKDLRENKDFVGLKNSALARSRADWLIGMNLSRAYSIKARSAGYTSAVSVGRVQTPTMALVVRREHDIKNFKPITHYQVAIKWQHANGMLPTIWQPADTSIDGFDSEGRLIQRDIANTLLTKVKTVAGYNKANILKIEQKTKQDLQCLPYSLSSLQIDAGKRFGYTPQQVLDTMQGLYEKKLTTYPRSDCDYLPENQFSDAKEILQNLKNLHKNDFHHFVDQANLAIRSRAWNDKKISAHHAIIPTRSICDFDSLSEVQQNLYYMVAQAYLAQFYEVHKYLATKIWILCSDEQFTTNGKTILSNGWKSIYKHEIQEAADQKEEPTLPQVQENDVVEFSSGDIIEKITKPPVRFNPSTLLKAMKEIYKYVKDSNLKTVLKECSGIGTEATRASIIDKLQSTGFLALEKKYLVPTEKANMIISVLSDDITYPDTTALWEKGLEDISQQNLSLIDFFEQQIAMLNEFLEKANSIKIEAPKNAVLCPVCKKPMLRRKGPKEFFWGCSGYPKCKSTAADKKGKPDFTPRRKK